MDGAERPLSKWKQPLLKLRDRLRPSGDVNLKRLQRKRALFALLTRRLWLIKFTLFLAGYLWMIYIPSPLWGRGTYIDENALQPAQVNTNWNWGDVHAADRHLEQLECIRDGNWTSEQRARWLKEEFGKHGVVSSTQRYSFSTSLTTIHGTNAYAVLASPRHSGTEAMIISASWLSRSGEGDGTINIRGVSTVLALAGFLKRYSYWAKDIVFVVSDGYLDGMQAWLGAYHGSSQSGLYAEPLQFTSGVIWTALNIDYPGHSFSHLGVFFEGLNGRLPNQDLINSFERIARYTAGVSVTVYDHLDPRAEPSANKAPWFLPQFIYNIPEVKGYLYQANNIVRHAKYQASGRGSGVHGLFHQFRIDAITLFAVPAMGPHGFHAIGRTIESTLRTMNNLLERLHASFFFYILPGPQRFLKIGLYLPSVILISVAMMFHGLSIWSNAGWVEETLPTEKESKVQSTTKWRRRRRPIISALCIMIATHTLGLIVFNIVTTPWFMKNPQALSPCMLVLGIATPLLFVRRVGTDVGSAPTFMVLKAFNLCLSSTVISIITLLNFSLAASLTLFLTPVVALSSPALSAQVRLIKYSAYASIAFAWLLFHQSLVDVVWSWQVLSVWLAPFICIVYTPLVLQAAIVCSLPC
ncbi:unnamed protein product [Cyclocybe aegerita]|uniref:Gaa1-domain-containing protein n=1 Tax=Cyclocybe aegerita TaxID=1973307 RepID=A0A8S0X2C0_CYCAE|nr:unnamed protein product [Cyclocybe aegerita]